MIVNKTLVMTDTLAELSTLTSSKPIAVVTEIGNIFYYSNSTNSWDYIKDRITSINLPIVLSNGNLSITQADSSSDGFINSADYNKFSLGTNVTEVNTANQNTSISSTSILSNAAVGFIESITTC